MSESSWIRSEWKEIILYLFLGIFTTLVLSLVVGLVWKGFEDSFVSGKALTFGSYLANFLIYIPFLIISLFCIIFPIARMVTLKRGESPVTKPNPSWWRIFTVSFLYAPEENGALWKLSEYLGFKGERNFMRWSLNPLRVLVVSILLFGIFGLILVSNPQLAVSSVPELGIQAQQVTVASEVTFSSFVPSFSENGVLLFVFMLLMGINAYICAKFKLGYGGFFAIGFFICIFMGLFWAGLHSIIYSGSDTSLLGTFLFGFIGSLITMLSGIFLFWWIFHITNNMFLKLAEIISIKEDIIFITGIVLFLIAVIWVAIEIKNKKKHKMQLVSIEGS